MELTLSLFAWSSICLLAALLLLQPLRPKTRKCSHQLPPGPRGFPLVGNLFDLGKVPHQTLAGLSQKYGPVVRLQLGSMNTVVIQSTKAAKEMFKNHDLSFVGRTITEAMRACDYEQGSLALAQYGPQWRTLRRICFTEFSVHKRVNETMSLRRKCIDSMIQWIGEEAQKQDGTCGVHVAQFVFLMSFNLLGNIMFSRDLVDPQCKEGSEFFNSMEALMKWSGTPNVADFFPSLKWLDPQGVRMKMEQHLGQAIQIVSGFVMQHIRKQQLDEEKMRKDFLDVLLAFEGDGKESKDGPAKISDKNVVIILLEIFLAGTETTSITIEWAMAELLHNPKIMAKVRKELCEVVGWKRKVEESDIDSLPYLQAVVKETLRLHPPIPFLIPRRAVEDTNFMGYWVPKDTQVLVNAWALGRDSDSWNEPLTFKPERFLSSNVDYQGQHFELIPFGAGRRMCIGLPLAQRILHLTLASLLQTFDWELEQNVDPDTLNMEERIGTTLRMAVPLKAIPTKRIIEEL